MVNKELCQFVYNMLLLPILFVDIHDCKLMVNLKIYGL